MNQIAIHTYRLSYKQFEALYKASKCSISTGNGSFALSHEQCAGLRELARRML
jgi:hypothetical protein